MILSTVRLACKAFFLPVLLVACAAERTPAVDTPRTPDDPGIDTTAVGGRASVPPAAPHRPLSPAADSVAQRLTFGPTSQHWFAAAARGKRMLVDLGRVDLEVSKPASRIAAFREAVASRSPVPVGTRLRLSGPWGADDATVASFDAWNGRIVAVLSAPRRVDSLASHVDPLLASAQLADSARPSTDRACASAGDSLTARLDSLRDSVIVVLRGRDVPASPRLRAAVRERSSRVTGCFDGGVAMLAVALVAGDFEWVHERLLLVAGDGTARVVAVRDYRFRQHDLIAALDADEDGFDDIAARAFTVRAGGSVILRLSEGKRLERLGAGFAWER